METMNTKKLIDTADFTDEQREVFITGWKDAGGYMGDSETSAPWCAPWTWGTTTIEVMGEDVAKWGAQHWHKNRAEIERLIDEADNA